MTQKRTIHHAALNVS